HRLAGGVGHAHAGAERQRAMGGGELARVEALAARGAAAGEPGSVPAGDAAADDLGVLVVDAGFHREVDPFFGDFAVERLVERDEARQRRVVFRRGLRDRRDGGLLGGVKAADRSAESEKRDRGHGGPGGHGGVPVHGGGGHKRRFPPAEPARRRFTPAMARLVGLSAARAKRAETGQYG